jgi:hypothetical protein
MLPFPTAYSRKKEVWWFLSSSISTFQSTLVALNHHRFIPKQVTGKRNRTRKQTDFLECCPANTAPLLLRLPWVSQLSALSTYMIKIGAQPSMPSEVGSGSSWRKKLHSVGEQNPLWWDTASIPGLWLHYLASLTCLSAVQEIKQRGQSWQDMSS